MLDKDQSRFVKVCVLTLAIQTPVRVRVWERRIITRHQGFSGVAGLHFFDKNVHEIDVLKTKKWRGGTLAIIAHELAHAWVTENHPKATSHGRTFQRTAAGLRRALKTWGYDLPHLYIKGLDA